MLMLLLPGPAPMTRSEASTGRLLCHSDAAPQSAVYLRLFTMSVAFGSAVRLTSCRSITMDVERRDSQRSAVKAEVRHLRLSILQVSIEEDEDGG